MLITNMQDIQLQSMGRGGQRNLSVNAGVSLPKCKYFIPNCGKSKWLNLFLML